MRCVVNIYELIFLRHQTQEQRTNAIDNQIIQPILSHYRFHDGTVKQLPEANPDNIAMMLDIGFEGYRVVTALQLTNNNVAAAIEWIYENQTNEYIDVPLERIH